MFFSVRSRSRERSESIKVLRRPVFSVAEGLATPKFSLLADSKFNSLKNQLGTVGEATPPLSLPHWVQNQRHRFGYTASRNSNIERYICSIVWGTPFMAPQRNHLPVTSMFAVLSGIRKLAGPYQGASSKSYQASSEPLR